MQNIHKCSKTVITETLQSLRELKDLSYLSGFIMTIVEHWQVIVSMADCQPNLARLGSMKGLIVLKNTWYIMYHTRFYTMM